MELKIDDQRCDLGDNQIEIPGYDTARTETINAAREGRSLSLSIPFSKRNNPIMGGADDTESAERFNDALHTAELTHNGVRMIGGTVRLLAVKDRTYEIEIRSGGDQWAEQASLRKFSDLELDWSMTLSPTEIYKSWTDETPVRFLPVHHDEYEQQNSSSDLLPAERILAVEDYHPFLHIATLVGLIFSGAGYQIKSDFFASDLFQSLYMSGAYASRDTAAAVNRMGFYARRVGAVTASANESGRVWANPDMLANTVGNIVDTATPQTIDDDGEAISGLYNNGNCFALSGSKIVYTPLSEITVGFEYYIKYTTSHRILSRSRLKGFDTIYLGPGAEFGFQLTNRYQDLRGEITSNFLYRVIVFDHVDGDQYQLIYTLNGFKNCMWGSFSTRSTLITTPANGTVSDPIMQILSGNKWVDYTGDWALYNGYIGETGETTVEIRLRSPSEQISKTSPKYFNLIYFSGAEEGMSLTLHKECSLRPLFQPGPTFGSVIDFSDISHHDLRQSELLEALVHLFNLRFFTEEETRTVWIEPEDRFFGIADIIDWSDRTDFSQQVIREQIAPEIHETRTWKFQDGDGAVSRFNSDEETSLGSWSFKAGSYATLQGEEELSNPVFAPTLNATGLYLNAPSAWILQVGDRDDAEEDGTNFTPRIIRYAGIKTLPENERWGYPSGRNEYPLAAFLFPGDDTTDPFTLGFEDRNGAEGLHRYLNRQVLRESIGERISLALRIHPHEFETLFSPGVGGPDIRSVFRINTGNGIVRAALRKIEAYNPQQASTRCVFERIDQL